TSWRLADGGGAVTVFAQPAGRQLLNPLGRTLLTLRRERVGETLAVVDARPAGVGRLLNLAPSDWALVRGDEALAGIGFAGGPDTRGGGEAPAAGVRGRLRRLAGALAGHDRCLASGAGGHALTAPEALVLLLLFEVLTATGQAGSHPEVPRARRPDPPGAGPPHPRRPSAGVTGRTPATHDRWARWPVRGVLTLASARV